MSRYQSRRLAQLETRLVQRQEIADAEGLQKLAELTRAKILGAIDRHKRGEPLPTSSVDRDVEPSEARDRLRQKLHETGDRLRRYLELRERYGIQ